MLSEVLSELNLDHWEQQLVAYVFLQKRQDLERVCEKSLGAKLQQAQDNLKLLPAVWANELCQLSLD